MSHQYSSMVQHMLSIRTRVRDERGANLVEYALIVALIAVVVVGAVTLFGTTVQQPYSEISSNLG